LLPRTAPNRRNTSNRAAKPHSRCTQLPNGRSGETV